MNEELFIVWRAHLPPTHEGFDWAMQRLSTEGLDDLVDAYAHALGVFYREPEPRDAAWTPRRIAVAALLLRHSPLRFVSAPDAALVVDFLLEAAGAEATLRGLWETRSLVARILFDGSEPRTLLMPGTTKVGDTPSLRSEVWEVLRERLELQSPSFVPVDLWEGSDEHGRALLSFLCPWHPAWAQSEARALLATEPDATTRYGGGQRAERVLASLDDSAVASALIEAMLRLRFIPLRDRTRPSARAMCRRGGDFIVALFPAANVDLLVVRELLATDDPVVYRYLVERLPEPLRRHQGEITRRLAADGARDAVASRRDALGRRLQAVLAAPEEGDLPRWAAPGSLPGLELDGKGALLRGLLRAPTQLGALTKLKKAVAPALCDRLPELALELFERWRLFGAEDEHAGVAKLLTRLPSEAAADRLGQMVWELRDLPHSGDSSADREEARHRLTYLDLLAAMGTDRALGWLGKCAADRHCTPEVRRKAKQLLTRAAKKRETDVAGLPRLDAESTAFARLEPSVRRRADRLLVETLRFTAVELELIFQGCEDDTYEVRQAEITRQWERVVPELAALLPAELPKRERAAVIDELCERFTLDCMEASPKWAQ